jgi:hypothetical protein
VTSTLPPARPVATKVEVALSTPPMRASLTSHDSAVTSLDVPSKAVKITRKGRRGVAPSMLTRALASGLSTRPAVGVPPSPASMGAG